MADTPESLVYRGREGTGVAQIFGTEGNPMRAYQQRKQNIERIRAIEAEQNALAKKDRDKKMWEMINVSPDKAFAPFNKQVLDRVTAHRAKIAQDFEQGRNPEDIQVYAKNGWDEINDIALRTNYIKDVITETNNVLEKNPYLNREYYFGKINDMYLDPQGNALPIDNINADAIRNIYLDDPLGFNEAKYHKDYMDGLNENVVSYIRQKAQNNGIVTTDGETKWKGNVYTPDPNSPIGVKVDAQGQPIVNVTPEVVNSYLGSDTAKRYYETLAQQQGVNVADIVKNRVSGIQVQERPVFTKNSAFPQWMYELNNPGLKPDEKAIAGRVFEHIDNITNAFFDKNGNRVNIARPEAREALGHLKGSKYGSGIIDDFELVPGTNKPGSSTYFDKPIENSPNDRVILKIKSGTAGRTSIDPIDITDESAPSALWNRFREGEYMGKKAIAFDFAADQLGVDPPSLYKGREYKGQKQIAEQEKVNAWVQGKDIGEMLGKSYRGQPIVQVTKDESWLGNFHGYKLKLANGNEIKVPKDDYDTFTDIYRTQTNVAEEKNATPKISSEEEYKKLPVGSQYIDPSGNVRTKSKK